MFKISTCQLLVKDAGSRPGRACSELSDRRPWLEHGISGAGGRWLGAGRITNHRFLRDRREGHGSPISQAGQGFLQNQLCDLGLRF